MTDKLGQIGKHINKQQKDTAHFLKDFKEHFPLIERARDVLGATEVGTINGGDFFMEFETYQVGNSIFLDIFFENTYCGGEGGGGD